MSAINPLPSLLRASALDAADAQMRKAGRKQWNDDDADLAADTLNRLVEACYRRKADKNRSLARARFYAAEQLERAGGFRLSHDMEDVRKKIEETFS